MPNKQSVLLEGVLEQEVPTTFGKRFVGRYVRLLPGSIATWATKEKPVPGTAPKWLFLLDDVEMSVDGALLTLREKTTKKIVVRLHCKEKKWIQILGAQYKPVEKKKVRRSASVPPPKTEDLAHVERRWDDFIHTQAQEAQRREASTRLSTKDALREASLRLSVRACQEDDETTSSGNSPPPRPPQDYKKNLVDRRKVLSFASSELGFSLELRRYSDSKHKLVIPRIKPYCEHVGTLKPGDELIAVNGAAVPTKFPREAFAPLLKRLADAPRPIKLTFKSKWTNDDGDGEQEDPSRLSGSDSSLQEGPTSTTPLGVVAPSTLTTPAAAEKELPTQDTGGFYMELHELSFHSARLGFVLARDARRGVAVVSRVHETCERLGDLQVRDELVALEGAPVPRPMAIHDFNAILKIIKASKRPLTITIRRKCVPRSTLRGDAIQQPTLGRRNDWSDFIQEHGLANDVDS